MVISNLVNRKKEITIGNLILTSICLVMESKEFQTEQLKRFVLRDMGKIFQKLLLLKRLQKILKVFHLIFQDNLEIQAKVKILDQIMCMVLRTYRELTHGMQPDVFMVNHKHKRYYQTKIQVNLLNQIAETQLEKKKTLTEASAAQLLEKISLTRILEVQLIIK